MRVGRRGSRLLWVGGRSSWGWASRGGFLVHDLDAARTGGLVDWIAAGSFGVIVFGYGLVFVVYTVTVGGCAVTLAGGESSCLAFGRAHGAFGLEIVG